MAISLVQKAKSGVGSGTSVTVTLPGGTTAGNMLVAVLMSDASDTDTFTPPAGWALAVAHGFNGIGAIVAVYYLANCSAGSTSFAFTRGSGGFPFSALVAEYSGLATTSPLDKTATGDGTSGAGSAGSITTTQADELLIFAVNFDATATVTAGSSMTLEDSLQNSGSTTAWEQRILTATGTYSPTMSQSTGAGWTAVQASFKAASGGTTNSLTTQARAVYVLRTSLKAQGRSRFLVRTGLTAQMRTRFLSRVVLQEQARTRFLIAKVLKTAAEARFVIARALRAQARTRFVIAARLAEQTRTAFSVRTGLAARARTRFQVRTTLAVRARTKFSIRNALLTTARTTFKIAAAGTKALTTAARTVFVSRTTLAVRARTKFSIRRTQQAQARTRYAIRFLLMEQARTKYFIRFSLAVRTRTRFLIRLALATQARSRYMLRSALATLARSTFIIFFTGRALPLVVTEGKPAALLTATTAGAVQLLTAASGGAAQLLTVTGGKAMVSPFSTIQSPITVKDIAGNPVTNLSAIALTVTYPDGSTTQLSLGSGILNSGAGVYTATYATKDFGRIQEDWALTAADGVTVAKVRFTVPVSYQGV